MAGPTGDACPNTLARASRRPHGTALAHPDRLQSRAAAAPGLPTHLCTRQNRPGKPGLYRFYLAHTWSTTVLPDGAYRLEEEASDLRGNTGTLKLPFAIANDV